MVSMISENAQFSSKPALTEFMRLTVYSYLDLEVIVKKISYLGKKERENLKDSRIMSIGKELKLDLRRLATLQPYRMIHESKPETILKRVSYCLSLCESLHLSVDWSKIMKCKCGEHPKGEVLAYFVSSLPQKFNNHLSITHYLYPSVRCMQIYGDEMIIFGKALEERCPDIDLDQIFNVRMKVIRIED